MKSLTLALLAATLAAAPAIANLPREVVVDDLSEYNTLTWFNQYYKNPQPELVPHRVAILSRMGTFEDKTAAAQAVGFFAKVFAQNPEKVQGWFTTFRELPLRDQRVLAAGLWLSGVDNADTQLRLVGARLGSTLVEELLASSPRALREIPIDSDLAMHAQWGAFVASGDSVYIGNILTAAGSKQQQIAEAARFSLALKASQDERVLHICRAELAKQPEAIQEVLRAALNEAPATTPAS